MNRWLLQLTAEGLLETALVLGFGYLLADLWTAKWQWGPLYKWALAFPSVVAFSFVLMLGHIGTGGFLFSRPWLIRAIAGGVAALLLARKALSTKLSWAPREVLPVLIIVGLAIVLWGWPIARFVPLASGGDITWHMGWASQLMNGETTPSSILAGPIPNYYPWMFHALIAFLAPLTPGGHGYHVLGSLQLLQVSAVVLGLSAVGRYLAQSWIGGVSVPLFGALASGPLIRAGSWFAIDPLAERGGRGTYTSSFDNIAPALPRDIANALIVAFLLLILLGLQNRNRYAWLSAGVLLGIVGLMPSDGFLVGLVAVVVIILVRKAHALLPLTVAPAIAIYALWAVPLAFNYGRLGGFTNTTAEPAPDPSLLVVLVSWGVITPLAAYAVVRWIRGDRERPDQAPVFAMLAASAALVVASSVFGRFAGGGFEMLGRAPRYWPLLYLSAAILAGVEAANLVSRLPRDRVLVAGLLSVVTAVASVVVPARHSLAIPQNWRVQPALREATLGMSNVVAEAARAGRARCVVAAPRFVQMQIFSFAGYRQVAYRGADIHAGNYARIRWREIYERIPPDHVRLAHNDVLIRGKGPIGRWQQLARAYGVDMVVVGRQDLGAQVFRQLFPGQVARLTRERTEFSLFRVDPCDES